MAEAARTPLGHVSSPTSEHIFANQGVVIWFSERLTDMSVTKVWPLHLQMLVFLYMCLSSKVSLILYFVDYKYLKFNNWYVYPDWAYALGWMMALTSFAVLILTTAGQMCHTSGTFMQVGVVKIPLLTASIFIAHITMTCFSAFVLPVPASWRTSLEEAGSRGCDWDDAMWCDGLKLLTKWT